MILKKHLIIAFVLAGSLTASSQNSVCSSPDDNLLDLNTIGKCAIENFKKSNKEEYVKISTRNRYVRRKTNTYLSKLRNNISSASTSTAKKVIYTMDNVDHLPTFSTCTSTLKADQLACFKDQVQAHISSSLNYPQDAFNLGVEDKVLTTFTINTNGYVKDIKVESAKHNSSLENEAKRVINSLPKLNPAKHAGKVAEVRHKFYVNFELANARNNTSNTAVSHGEEYIRDFVRFDEVTQKPVFITCADYAVGVRQECIKETIMHDILDNLTYPFDAAAEGIEGRVWVRFIIDEDGYVSNITTSGPQNGALLEEEAERLVKLLPKFIPGKHNDEYVNVEYFIPIDFHLDE